MTHSWAKASALSVCISKDLLEHSDVHLYIVLASLTFQVELSSCNREHLAHKAKNIYYLPLH